MKSKLLSFRQNRNWELQDLARELSMPTKEYQLLEEGKRILDVEIAIKLADLYQVPVEIFLAELGTRQLNVIYSQCSFTGGSNGYINHLYQETDKAIEIITQAKNEEILQLKKEIKRLRKENSGLINRFIDKK